MPSGTPVNIDIAAVGILYRSGLSIREVAERFGVSHTVIRIRLRNTGIARRSHAEANQIRKYTPKDITVEWQCKRCNVVLRLNPGRAKRRKLCSFACYAAYRREYRIGGKALPRPVFHCVACNKQYMPAYPAERRRFCSPECSRYYSHVTRHGTSWFERTIHAYLLGANVTFIPEWRLDGYMADIYLPAYHAAIECDGDYWHMLPMSIRASLKKERLFIERGIPVLHITESETSNDLPGVVRAITNFIVALGPHPTNQQVSHISH